MSKELKEKIARLTEEENYKSFVARKLKGFKTLAMIHRWKDKNNHHIVVDLRKEDVAKISKHISVIVKLFRPSANNEIRRADGVTPTCSPFTIVFKNGVRENSVDINYQSKEHEMTIEVPVEFYDKELIQQDYRGVTDCEYHYYGGTSMGEIMKIRLRTYKLRDTDYMKSVSYFGGNKTMFLADAGMKTRYEQLVITGK